MKQKDKKRKKASSSEESAMESSKITDGEERTGRLRERSDSKSKKGRPSQSRDRQQTLLTQAFVVKQGDNAAIVERLEALQKTTDSMKQLIENSRCSLAEQIDKKLEILTSTLFELRTENDLLKKILEQTQNQVNSLEEESQSLRIQCAEQKEQINVLEQYSRRESIRVFGIQGDRKEETPAECEKKILHMIQNVLGLRDIDSAKISTLHRVGRVTTNKPRPVIIKFVSRKDRDQVIKTRNRLKGSNVVITEDLTKLNVQRLNRLRQHDGVLDAWSAAGGRLFVKLIDLSIMEIKNGDTNPIEKKLVGVTREQQRPSREPNRQQRYRQGEQRRQQDQRQHHQRSGRMEDDRHGASPSRSHFSPTTYSTPSTTWVHAPKPVLETDMVLHQHDSNKEQQPSASDVSNIDMQNTSRTLDNPPV